MNLTCFGQFKILIPIWMLHCCSHSTRPIVVFFLISGLLPSRHNTIRFVASFLVPLLYTSFILCSLPRWRCANKNTTTTILSNDDDSTKKFLETPTAMACLLEIELVLPVPKLAPPEPPNRGGGGAHKKRAL